MKMWIKYSIDWHLDWTNERSRLLAVFLCDVHRFRSMSLMHTINGFAPLWSIYGHKLLSWSSATGQPFVMRRAQRECEHGFWKRSLLFCSSACFRLQNLRLTQKFYLNSTNNRYSARFTTILRTRAFTTTNQKSKVQKRYVTAFLISASAIL